MPTNFELYKSRLNKYKIGEKNGRIDLMKNAILKDFLLSPSHETVLINNISYDVHIIDKNEKNKTMLMKPNESIMVGDIVLWNDKNYICTYINDNIKVQYKTIITKCNNVLTFQDDDTLEIHTVPCIIEDKTITNSLNETEPITLAKDKKLMIVPDNNITRKLYLGLNKKRYIFNNNKNDIYTISHIDDITQPGLLNIIMEISEYNPSSDRLDLNIADYKEAEMPDKPQEPSGITYFIEGANSIIWTLAETYRVLKYEDGEEFNGKFTFELAPIDGDFATIENTTDNTVTLLAKEGVYGYIKIIATDIDNGEKIEKKILIKGLI